MMLARYIAGVISIGIMAGGAWLTVIYPRRRRFARGVSPTMLSTSVDAIILLMTIGTIAWITIDMGRTR